MIVLRSISKTFGTGAAQVQALRGIDLDVESGQFVRVMGPSGCGKSTLLNLISALDTPTTGQVEINGQDISALDDDALTLFRRRNIGLVFQFFNLLPTLNALDNTLLPVMLERTPTAADRKRAIELLHDVGLGGSHSAPDAPVVGRGGATRRDRACADLKAFAAVGGRAHRQSR